MSVSTYIENHDTICAVATGMGRTAIAIIRVSGPEAIGVVDGIFVGRQRVAEMETFTAAFGRITDDMGEVIDEAIVLVMKGPHTYTTEDTVEIDLHGGPLVVRRVTELLLEKGVRMAEPGEFTKKAFLGGRIDMSEAEAVMDVIDAVSNQALRASMKQLRGGLREKVTELREKLLYETAYIESALDDPENYSLDGYSDKLQITINEIKSEIDRLLMTADEGRIIREGIRTVIVGRPNVGKSSMLNKLLGEERAIVTDIAGTTRDTLEELVDIGGVVLRLTDTAGIRATDDMVERIGVDRARAALEDAELVLMLIDAERGLTYEDIELAGELAGKKVILIINKIDTLSAVNDINDDLNRYIDTSELTNALNSSGVESHREIYTSAKTGQGIEELRDTIKEMFFSSELESDDDGLMITHSRHKEALISAGQSLAQVLESIDSGLGEDFYTIDLMAAYESLGRIIGETLDDDLADKIFSEFCMGK